MLAGADEAGRGALVGAVFAGAVILPERYHLPHLKDSKRLSASAREALFQHITEQALAYAIASVSAQEIDVLNIHQASLLAMKRAIEALSIVPTFVQVDGKFTPKIAMACEAVIGGDDLIPEISSASILAKVARDREMIELDKRYPEYGFAKHKGYATKQHLEALQKYGICPEHRKSFAPIKPPKQQSLF